jgi:hypothetical protein
MKLAGHMARMGKRGIHMSCWLERQKERDNAQMVDNIKMNLREVGFNCMNWVYLAQDRDSWKVLVDSVINFRVL